MAKVDNFRQDYTLPHSGERFVMKTHKGKLIVQKWPKKRGKNLHPKVILQNQRFKNANLLAKYADPLQQARAIQLGQKGPLYPRDYLMAAMLGGLYIFQRPNGTKVFPMALVNEVSHDFDVIAQLPGSMLGRGPTHWEPVGPGTLYQVPAVLQLGEAPVMTSPGPEIGGNCVSAFYPDAQHSGTAATKGFWLELQKDIRVTNMIPSFDGISIENYSCSIWEFDGTKLTNLLDQSDVTNWLTTAFARRRFLMPLQPILKAGNQYAFLFSRTSATPTSSNQLWWMNKKSNAGLPANDNFGLMTFAKTFPAVNDTPTYQGYDDPGCIDLLYVM